MPYLITSSLTINMVSCLAAAHVRKCWTATMTGDEPLMLVMLLMFVLIDFTKAFDVVPHSHLLRKLASMGVCQLTLKWLRSFLSGRSQVVDVNSLLSSPGDVSSGIIQGSVKGPVLFTL